MEGKFWIRDLGKILEEEDGLESLKEPGSLEPEGIFSHIGYLPSKSKIVRWLGSKNSSVKLNYCRHVFVNYTGYYDKSGKDVKVTENIQIPEDVPFRENIGSRIAKKNNVNFNGRFYSSNTPTNDLEKVREHIRGINAATEQFKSFADDLADV